MQVLQIRWKNFVKSILGTLAALYRIEVTPELLTPVALQFNTGMVRADTRAVIALHQGLRVQWITP